MQIFDQIWLSSSYKNISGKRCRGIQNTPFTFNNFFPKIVPFKR